MAKKRKPRKRVIKHTAEGGSASYMGIGHSGGEVTVWAWVDGGLEMWEDDLTHEDVMGKNRFDYWRGRYEGFTHTCSAVPPCDTQYSQIPTWLKDALEMEFGGDIEFHSFNPPPRGS